MKEEAWELKQAKKDKHLSFEQRLAEYEARQKLVEKMEQQNRTQRLNKYFSEQHSAYLTHTRQMYYRDMDSQEEIRGTAGERDLKRDGTEEPVDSEIATNPYFYALLQCDNDVKKRCKN